MAKTRCDGPAGGCLVLILLMGAAAWGMEGASVVAEARPVRAFAGNIVIPQTRTVSMADGVGQRVQLTAVHAQVEILEQVATTTLTIFLHNPTGQRQEAELLVPAPDEAVVRGFTFEGGAKEPTAQLLPKDEARRIYDSIVRQTRDPALLEFVGYRLIRSSVFPVEPDKGQKVQVTYEHLCPMDLGRVDYLLPRSESLEYAAPWKISARVKSKAPVSTVYSPSHQLAVERKDEHTVLVSTAEEAVHQPGAFRLCYLPETEEVSASLLACPKSKDGGYFLLLAGLPARPEKLEAAPLKREVTLVLDRSGSMSGEKIQQVREAALQIVTELGEGEAFNIIPYNEAVESFAAAPVPKNRESLEAARKYIQSITPRGGTNIHDALLEALRQKPSPGMLPLVLFLTDGLPTVGNTSESAIRELAAKSNPHHRRIFSFGVGVDVNTPLLDKIADLTRATATFVLPKEAVDEKVQQVFRRLNGPVLANPTLAVVGPDGKPAPGRTHDLLPNRLPDLFEGDQLVLLGQYVDEKPLRFELRGNFLGRERVFRFNFEVDRAGIRNAFVPRLWAGRKIAVLIDEIRSLGADRPRAQAGSSYNPNDPRLKELIDEVVKLSQEFGILTEYTAFLAREGTDFSDAAGNQWNANARFQYRAIGRRDGQASVTQELNLGAFRGQQTLNPGNYFQNTDLQSVSFANVQQFNGNGATFWNNDGRWVEAKIAQRQKAAEIKPQKTIEFGSEEFMALVQKLAGENRQSTIALRGEIILEVDQEVVLVRNPLVPADLAGAPGQTGPRRRRWRSNSRAATSRPPPCS